MDIYARDVLLLHTFALFAEREREMQLQVYKHTHTVTATDKQKQKRRWQAGKVADNETQRAYRKKQRQIVDRQTGTEANRDKGETETETDRREEKQTGTAANRQCAGPEQRQTGEFDIRRQQQTDTKTTADRDSSKQEKRQTAADRANARQRH